MDVWHLLDDAGGDGVAVTLEMLAQSHGRLSGIRQRIILLGSTGLRQAAQRAGLACDVHLGVPLRRPVLGYAALRRRVRAMTRPDLIHCWSPGSAMLAAMLPASGGRILTLNQWPTPAALRWCRAVVRSGTPSWTVLTISATLRHGLACRGIDIGRLHVLRPGIDLGRVDRAQRQTLRAGWDVDDDTTVLALIADPPAAGDALQAAMVASLTDFARSDRTTRIQVLVHPRAHLRRRAVLHMRAVEHDRRIICDPRLAAPWEVLPGCDAVLATGDGAGGPGLLWAMAAGVPIVADASSVVGELLEDRHSALLAPPGDAKRLAHRLLQLLEDDQLAWKLSDTARHEAFSLFSRQHYCQSLQTVYGQIVEGQPIDVPGPPVTGGMRFMGRA